MDRTGQEQSSEPRSSGGSRMPCYRADKALTGASLLPAVPACARGARRNLCCIRRGTWW